jgi:hypothetical protein
MTPDNFDEATRDLTDGGTRRAAFGALVAAAVTAFLPDDGEARRFKVPGGRRKGKGKGKNKNKDRRRAEKKGSGGRKKKDKEKKKSKKKSRGGGGGGGCTSNYTEKEILGFIKKAANEYGQSASAMERVARCESVLDPCAVNKDGPWYGLFQYLKSTWRSTPYGNESIWDPEAQSMATAWMWKQGRKNEWACK